MCGGHGGGQCVSGGDSVCRGDSVCWTECVGDIMGNQGMWEANRAPRSGEQCASGTECGRV